MAASDLILINPGAGLNCYAQARRLSDLFIANQVSEAHQAYNVLDWEEYAIPLVESAADFYTAAMPAWMLAEGNPWGWLITYYVQAGATPASTDEALGAEELGPFGSLAAGGTAACPDLSGGLTQYACYPETVTLSQSTGASAAVAVRKFAVNDEEAQPSNGVYRRWATSFRMAYSQAASAVQVGDTIVDGAVTWTVTELSKAPFNMGYFLSCLSLNFNDQLTDLVDIYLPVMSTDAWADDVNTPAVAFANVPCRVQPAGPGRAMQPSTEPSLGNDKYGFADYFDVIIEADYDLPADSYLLVQDPGHPQFGKKLMVVGLQRQRELVEFPVIKCAIKP